MTASWGNGTRPTMRSVWAKRLALLLGAALIADLAAGQVARQVFDLPWWIEAERAYRTRSPIYHHDLLPNISVTTRWGTRRYEVHTNSLGFKDARVRDVPLDPGARHLLFIGDSFTEGVGYAHDETFVGIIGERLAREGIVVSNAAVVSYAPSIYYRKIRHLIEDVRLRFDEVVVLLDLSDIHDEAMHYALEALDGREVVVPEPGSGVQPIPAPIARLFPANADAPWQHRVKRTLRAHSLTIRTLDALKDSIQAEPDERLERRLPEADRWEKEARRIDPDFVWPDGWSREALAHSLALSAPGAAWDLEDEAWEAFGRRGIEEATDSMDRLRSLLHDHGIALTLVVYPWPEHHRVSAGSLRHVAHWQAWAARHGVRFFDLFPALIDRDRSLANLLELYIPGDVHFSAGGHRRVASALIEGDLLAGAIHEPLWRIATRRRDLAVQVLESESACELRGRCLADPGERDGDHREALDPLGEAGCILQGRAGRPRGELDDVDDGLALDGLADPHEDWNAARIDLHGVAPRRYALQRGDPD